MDDDFDSYDDAMDGDDLQNWENDQAWMDGQADREDAERESLELNGYKCPECGKMYLWPEGVVDCEEEHMLENGEDGQGGEFYGFCEICGNELNKFDTCETCEENTEKREMHARDGG